MHRLRAGCDAVVVGSGTALTDDPQLTVRDADGRTAARQPLRVVVDRAGRLPATARVLDDAAPTLVSRAATPAAVLAELFDRDVRRVLLEGGPTLAAAFLRDGLVDEVCVHLAPTLLGAGPPWWGTWEFARSGTRSPSRSPRSPLWAGTCNYACAPPGTLVGGSTRTEGAEVFTGIVEEVGTLVVREDQSDSAVLQIRATRVLEDVALGDSISVNGVCLTVTGVQPDGDGAGVWSTDVMAETLRRSSLGSVGAGDPVNLERAVTMQTRLGGHMVQGHVDGVGRIVARTPGEHWEVVRIALPAALARYVVEKGSIAVDGVSLTVSAVSPADQPEPWFEVSLIPTTLARDHARRAHPGGPGQPGGRRDRQVRGTPAGKADHEQPWLRLDSVETRHRRHQGRPRRRRHRRRGPRERGRPDLRLRAGDPRARRRSWSGTPRATSAWR